jgi:hypothetical protein
MNSSFFIVCSLLSVISIDGHRKGMQTVKGWLTRLRNSDIGQGRRAANSMTRLWLLDASLDGGSGEIRTHGGDKPSLVFKTSALNHSATLPVLNNLSIKSAQNVTNLVLNIIPGTSHMLS